MKKQPELTRKRDLLLEPPANGCEERIALDPETRQRFVRALAELIAESMLRQHGQAK